MRKQNTSETKDETMESVITKKSTRVPVRVNIKASYNFNMFNSPSPAHVPILILIIPFQFLIIHLALPLFIFFLGHIQSFHHQRRCLLRSTQYISIMHWFPYFRHFAFRQ